MEEHLLFVPCCPTSSTTASAFSFLSPESLTYVSRFQGTHIKLRGFLEVPLIRVVRRQHYLQKIVAILAKTPFPPAHSVEFQVQSHWTALCLQGGLDSWPPGLNIFILVCPKTFVCLTVIISLHLTQTPNLTFCYTFEINYKTFK